MTRTLPITALLLTLAVGARADGPPDREVEPNEEPASASRLRLGVPLEGVNATGEDHDVLRVDVARRGPFALGLAQTKANGGGPLRARLRRAEGDDVYRYDLPAEAFEGLFFPVLEPGAWFLCVERAGSGAEPDAPWRVTLAPHEPVLTDADRAAAKAAIAKATALLARYTHDDAREKAAAITGLVLAASVEDADAAGMAELEARLVAPLAALLAEREGTLRGAKVRTFTEETYQHAVVTLGLAEAASRGSAKAKELLAPAAAGLLASQLTPLRCPAWRPVPATSPAHGGWRYAFDADGADISVTGWCVVALSATTAAGVQVPGTRDALEWATRCVERCHDAAGFVYEPTEDATSTGGEGDVRDAIGALVLLMRGEDGDVLDRGLENLDRHLSAWSQVDRGEGYPLYYAYYATRAHYLRGGYPWQVWRTTMLRQLLKNQSSAGGWTRFASEEPLPDEYATALGVMVLRMCLEQVPAYLKREVQGF